ncbi:MAG TPA: alkaline phosphatase family protein [Candidatus Angelobacter sp.]|nr:alkaline phosphatase family protein [Candidatus Angelobacter sp.]
MNKLFYSRKVFISLFLLILPGALFAQVPKSNHVVVVLEENHGYSSVIGNSAMPYLNSLAAKNALATQYYANTHPSIGNYLMLTTGQIITNNDGYSSTITADNIVRHLLTGGKTWKSYAESLPSVGYTGGDHYPYIRHHDPLSYFSDVVNSSVQKLNLVPFSHFAADLANGQLPDFSFVVPNINHDAHDCPAGPTGCTDSQKLATADAWLKTNIAPLLANPAFQQDGVVIIVFDEAGTSDSTHGGGRVAAVIVGPGVNKGFKSTVLYQHQNLLRTMLDALGVNHYPGAAATAKDMADVFIGGTPSPTPTPTPTPGPSGCTAGTVGVTVCSPAGGSTVASPVRFNAAARSTNPVTAMRIYIDGVSKYLINASTLDTSLSIASGTHSAVVQAWDSTGAVFKTTLTIHVP